MSITSKELDTANSPETVLATLRVVALLLIFAFGRNVLVSSEVLETCGLRGDAGLDTSWFREGGLEGG
jgi:hypothetical protein